MKTSVAALGLAATATAIPNLVERQKVGCSANFDGKFQITVGQANKRSLEKRACAKGAVLITLQNGVLHDEQQRIGYIAANNQFQFDNPVQAGTLAANGFTICSNGLLGLDGNTDWYRCLSGEFYNLYNKNQGGQCEKITIIASSCGDSSSGGPPPAVTQIGDGQAQAPTGNPVTQIGDGQVQAPTGNPITQIGDGQVQAPTGNPITQIGDGQVQAPTGTGAAITQIGDGQVQAPTAPPVTQIGDGQVQAPTGNPVSQISDGQVQAPTGAPTTLPAPPVTQIGDGQVQAPTGNPVTQIGDGQVQAPTGTPAPVGSGAQTLPGASIALFVAALGAAILL